ncbi:unnamed protein product [Thelazia callipaeda]|uniref:Uncharacterized protein n=1 Tax=Thelazia callipaeda TaxID=103827 RepID=A0A0N5CKL7_THECL|nr:unnamed protein product [Thelazia callipaeda]
MGCGQDLKGPNSHVPYSPSLMVKIDRHFESVCHLDSGRLDFGSISACSGNFCLRHHNSLRRNRQGPQSMRTLTMQLFQHLWRIANGKRQEEFTAVLGDTAHSSKLTSGVTTARACQTLFSRQSLGTMDLDDYEVPRNSIFLSSYPSELIGVKETENIYLNARRFRSENCKIDGVDRSYLFFI